MKKKPRPGKTTPPQKNKWKDLIEFHFPKNWKQWFSLLHGKLGEPRRRVCMKSPLQSSVWNAHIHLIFLNVKSIRDLPSTACMDKNIFSLYWHFWQPAIDKLLFDMRWDCFFIAYWIVFLDQEVILRNKNSCWFSNS